MNVVYRSGVGRVCPGCRRPIAQCACRDARGQAAQSVISGLPLPEAELAALAAELKKRCGSGGTVRAGTIEIQGEHRDTLVAELVKRGYSAKRSG